MSNLHSESDNEASQLHERILTQSVGREETEKTEVNVASTEDDNDKLKSAKTYGRTPSGAVFTVPETHDMVTQLLSPSEPKNISDFVILAFLAGHIAMAYILPPGAKIPVLGLAFCFWRACYNLGIGWLLQNQSKDNRLVNWARKSGLFESLPANGNKHHQLREVLKREMETKIPKDYRFEDAPIEYNTWLVFRRVVDLILMCDFVSYCLFAIVCGSRPDGESFFLTVGRWSAGVALFLFNLWVKLDAHRVVKDYAWYWGDFFFLIDQELTFDGVFEMAPHPMYSVGYAGYYGISLMAASYKVLFISIIAHASQFAFLTLVENPHIDKIYNPPQSRKRAESQVAGQNESQEIMADLDGGSLSRATSNAAQHSTTQPSTSHNLLGGFRNIDFHRVTDVSVILLQFYVILLALLTPTTVVSQILFVCNAVVWRLWYTIGIGYILDRQSKKKTWTRHYLKFGDDAEEAWRQWKGLYYLSMAMCYVSFIAAAWKMYALPADWAYEMGLLRHVIGAGLIALHIWIAISIYESLGEFGWFYGDFFFDPLPKLTYSGIYRFLNNPERFLGLAGVWGFAIITWSKAIFFLAFLSHICSLAFIHLVERPHMQILYGESLRRHSGLSKSFRRSLPPPIRQWQGRLDRGIERAADFIEELIETANSRLSEGVGSVVKDSKLLLKNSAARISITRVSEDLVGFDPKDYQISFEGTLVSSIAELDRNSGREGEHARAPLGRTSDFKTLFLEYGGPIKVKWKAPANHRKRDWIGLYMVSDNASRDVTTVASGGRWIATNRGEYDVSRADVGIMSSNVRIESDGSDGKEYVCGEMEFTGDKLWWTTGVFEFRYHHDGKHNVMAISVPFEIRIPRFEDDNPDADLLHGDFQAEVETALLPVVRNCFDRDPEIAPSTIDEAYGSLVERDGKFAKRVVFAVQQMFGVEFAPEVVQADGNVKNLAWRIFNAKKVLVPYSMSSKGRSTPVDRDY